MEGRDMKDWGLGGISEQAWTHPDTNEVTWQPVAGKWQLWITHRGWFFTSSMWSTDGFRIFDKDNPMEPRTYRSRARAHRIARRQRLRDHEWAIHVQKTVAIRNRWRSR